MADAIRKRSAEIIAANGEDVADGKAAGMTGSFLDRLTLDASRVEAMAAGLEVVPGSTTRSAP